MGATAAFAKNTVLKYAIVSVARFKFNRANADRAATPGLDNAASKVFEVE
jgi:hypothetical protein